MDVHVSLDGRRDITGQIYAQLRDAIVHGDLRPGDRLPPTRELAQRLAVSRTTVSVAYDRLMGEGFLLARVGAGTYVSDDVGASPSDGGAPAGALRARPVWATVRSPFGGPLFVPYDLRCGLPDFSRFPYESWRRLLSREIRPGNTSRSTYGEPAGHPSLRSAIARHVGVSRAVRATGDDIVVTNGLQQAVDLVARVLMAPGDRVAVEDPGYPPPRSLLVTLGMDVVGVPVDEEGIVVEAIPPGTRLVLVTPSHQFPLGHVMSLRRRVALLRWADRNDAAILEDDYDSEFRFGGRPVEPLQSLDRRGRVVYAGSFSKTLLPALRLGFLVTPASIRPALRAAKFVTDWATSTPQQLALAQFIDRGWFSRHLRTMRTLYHARHELITSIAQRDLADVFDVIPSAAGLHLSMLTPHIDADEATTRLAAGATSDGVAAYSLGAFGELAPRQAGVIIGYGGIQLADIPEAMRRLGRLLA